MRFRPAIADDAESIARLLVQLYQTEAPGMVGNDPERCARLTQRTLMADGAAALRNSYVIEHDGTVVAFGAVATREMPRRRLVSGGMIRDALRLIGPHGTARWLYGLARLLAAVLAELAEDEAQLHSIVVDRSARGLGLGEQMLKALERQAARLGKDVSVLHVLNGNTAEAFYEKHRYQVRHAADQVRSRLAYPGVVMTRRLESELAHSAPGG